MKKLVAGGCVALVCLTATVRADEISILATLAVQTALVELSDRFMRDTPHHLTLTFDTGPNLARRVADGASADVLIAPAAVVEQAAREGRVMPAPIAPIGRVAVGVATRKGARIPDVGTVEALKQALNNADAVVYSQGTSGVYIEKLFADLGIAAAITAKTVRLANGGAAMERIISGSGNDLGFTMISEVKMFEPRGAVLVGPLPAAVQNYTTYTAAIMTTSANRLLAAGLIDFLTNPAARRVLARTGWE